mmetsp:Transcript_36671/g.88606  ORF Transcript_36671/g.88606 Transcript_36671/m.88606 type:complete len:205 (-) Transcript_36671:16-630(-)
MIPKSANASTGKLPMPPPPGPPALPLLDPLLPLAVRAALKLRAINPALAYPARRKRLDPFGVPQTVQDRSVDALVLQPHASHVHRDASTGGADSADAADADGSALASSLLLLSPFPPSSPPAAGGAPDPDPDDGSSWGGPSSSPNPSLSLSSSSTKSIVLFLLSPCLFFLGWGEIESVCTKQLGLSCPSCLLVFEGICVKALSS